MANNKIRIRLKSFDHKILDNSAEKIIGAAKDVYKRQGLKLKEDKVEDKRRKKTII